MSAASNVVPFPNPHQVAVAVAAKPVVPYNLDPGYEAALVTACCCRPRLFAKVQEFIEVEAFAGAAAKLAWGALEALRRETGSGPSSLLIVVQRLRADLTAGKLTQSQLNEVGDLFDAAEDRKLPSDDDLLSVLVPLVTRRVEREALEESFVAFSKGDDLTKPMERVVKARQMADAEVEETSEADDRTRAEMRRRALLPRLPTGILELDDALRGGPKKGTAAMFLGESSAGKSMGLVQIGCASTVRGYHTAYASLELNKDDIQARYVAGLTGYPIDEATEDAAWNAFLQIKKTYNMGRFRVRQFTPKLTTVRDIVRWVEEEEETLGITIDTVIIDYGDKLGSGSRRQDESDTGYAAQGTVYDQMFTWTRDEERWLWTASQTNRDGSGASGSGGKGKTSGKVVQLEDTADSMGKVRNFDLVIGLNPRDDYSQMLFNIAKNRNGGGRGTQVGPLPVDFTICRIAPPIFPPPRLIVP